MIMACTAGNDELHCVRWPPFSATAEVEAAAYLNPDNRRFMADVAGKELRSTCRQAL
jgi:hypothetical protein